MGKIVSPANGAKMDGNITAHAIRWAGASSGWIGKANENYMAFTTDRITGAPLNAAQWVSGVGSSTATIDTYEAFVGGAYVANDAQSTVDLSSYTNTTKTLALGWKRGSPHSATVNTSDSFGWKDPYVSIFDVTMDGSGVIQSYSDLRPLGPQIDATGGSGITGRIQAVTLAGGQSARDFDYVPAGQTLELHEIVMMDGAGNTPPNLYFRINNLETGSQLDSYSGGATQYEGSDENPLFSVSGSTYVEFQLENQTTQDPGTFSARFNYTIEES